MIHFPNTMQASVVDTASLEHGFCVDNEFVSRSYLRDVIVLQGCQLSFFIFFTAEVSRLI